jgi:nickel/cobalt transporter (NiCoT) family protein
LATSAVLLVRDSPQVTALLQTYSSHTGTSVSGSFLFFVGVVNTVIVVKLLRRRRKVCQYVLDRSYGIKKQQAAQRNIAESEVDGHSHEKIGGLMTRLLGPVINFVDRPYKVRTPMRVG